MDTDFLVFDKKLLRSIVSENRIKILKLLGERRYTVTELAELLQTTKSNIFVHLQKLEAADLITQTDENRKWKYYELTKKGNELINTKGISKPLLILLSCFAFATFGSLIILYLILTEIPRSTGDHEFSGLPLELIGLIMTFIILFVLLAVQAIYEIIKRKSLKELL